MREMIRDLDAVPFLWVGEWVALIAGVYAVHLLALTNDNLFKSLIGWAAFGLAYAIAEDLRDRRHSLDTRAYEAERHNAIIELVQAVAALPQRTPRLQAALERWQKAVTRR